MHELNVVFVEHLHQHGLEFPPVDGAAEAAHAVGHPRGVVFQQDHQVKAVFVNQRLHKRVLAPFVFFAERLGGDKIGIDKCHLVGVFHREINVLGMPERNFVIVGILQRHLVATQVREDIVTAVLPRAGGVEDVSELVDQR